MSDSKLDGLKKYTTVVADSGDFDSIKQYKPQDATTNPSLLFKAAQIAEYKDLVKKSVADAEKRSHHASELLDNSIIHLFVNFGAAILKIVPGRVSTEVDARLSFDVQGSIDRAHRYLALYEELGVPRERVLIKLASTWEGIQAAKILEKEGVHCNMTLMFHLAQAIASAEAGATLISPFVGRIYDWQKKDKGVESIPADEDLGVISVRTIYHYYKHFKYKTQIMGASFRNIDEILELAGCDLLTISPDLLDQLSRASGPVARKLDKTEAVKMQIEKQTIDEKTFRWQICDSAMATEKLFDGIRGFTKDTLKLETYIKDHFLEGKGSSSSKAL